MGAEENQGQATTNTPTTESTATTQAAPVTAAQTQEAAAAAATTTPAEAKQDPAKADGKAATEAAKAEPAKVVPEKYELALPEHTLLPKEHVDSVSAFAKEHGFTQEQAQKVMERDNQIVADFIKSDQPGGDLYHRRVLAWEEQALADKELGGTAESLKQIGEEGIKVLNQFFPQEVQQFLHESGFGSHPAVLKGLKRMAAAMKDDRAVSGNANSAGDPENARLRRQYPSHYENKNSNQ